ncbi:MAG: exonuclease subunit SbcD [Porphyromonadaceae bacterium]|nr:exonuclease subunit SbcD [Porphyromonadaceae bacterium]
MKILHTSDWHLGRTLYTKKDRQDEHTAFLNWLLETINKQSIDILLIAGDVFDTASPSSTYQKIYYEFLVKVRAAGCENVIVVGGNHDSPSFLNAPKEILAALNVVVVGNASENTEDEIVIIRNSNDEPALIVCAVPFLRERDISRFAEGETYSDRSKRINENIKKHYEEIARLAENKRDELGKDIPIIATGHLSVFGGKRSEDDGVRETYIGNIEAISSDIFPETFEYVALGHYHIPSVMKEHIRYCGSPIPMGFGEAKQQKCVFVIDFNAEKKIERIEIPVFQNIESIVGNKDFIENRLSEIKKLDKSFWVEIIYTGQEIFPDFTAWLNEQIEQSKIEILKMQNKQYLDQVLTLNDTVDLLDELNEYDVFEKLLKKKEISEEQKIELKECYNEIVIGLNIED